MSIKTRFISLFFLLLFPLAASTRELLASNFRRKESRGYRQHPEERPHHEPALSPRLLAEPEDGDQENAATGDTPEDLADFREALEKLFARAAGLGLAAAPPKVASMEDVDAALSRLEGILREEKPGSPTAQQTADERQQQQQQPSEDNMNP